MIKDKHGEIEEDETISREREQEDDSRLG